MSGMLQWSLNLADQMSPGAKSAVGALKQLQSQLKIVDSQIAAEKMGKMQGPARVKAELQQQMKAMREAAKEEIALAKQVAREKAAAGASSKGGGHAGAITRVMTPHGSTSKAEALLGYIPGGGKIEAFSDKIQSLQALFGKLKPAAAEASSSVGGVGEAAAGAAGAEVLLVAAGAALVVGFLAIVGAGASLALRMSEAREKSIAMFDALGDGKVKGEEVLTMIKRLNGELPQSSTQLKSWTRELMTAGVTDLSKLDKSLRAIASAQAIAGEGGDEAAEKVKNLMLKLQTAQELGGKFQMGKKDLVGIGVTVDDIAKRLGTTGDKLKAQLKAGTISAAAFGTALQDALIEKGKGPLEAMGMSLEVMSDKFMGILKSLFSGVDVKPFLVAMKGFFSWAGGAVGGLKGPISGFFNAVFAGAARAAPVVKAFLQGMGSALGPVMGALISVGKAIAGAFGGMGGGGMKTVLAVARALGQVLAIVAVVVIAVVGAFLLLGAAFAAIIPAGIALVSMLVAGLVAGLSAVGDFLGDVWDSITSGASALWNAASEVGSNIAQGLADGISSGVSWVKNAVAGMGDAVISEVKKILGIASPSKVMAKLGGHTAEGFAQGIDDHTGPQDAMADMVSPPSGGAVSGGGGVSVNVGGITITVHGGADAKAVAEIIESSLASKVASLFEDVADQLGHSPAPA